MEEERKMRMNYFIQVLTIFMILGVVTRLFLQRYNINIPSNIFVLGFSIIAGGTIASLDVLRDSWFALKMAPQHAADAYLPVFIMSTMYGMDPHMFKRYFAQASMIMMSTALISPFVIGWFLTFLYPEYSFTHGLLLSLTILPLEPHYIIQLFQVLSNHKFLATMLQIEAVIIQIPQVMGSLLIGGYRAGIVDKWYHWFTLIGRELIGGGLVGFIMAVIHLRLILVMYHEPLHAVCVSALLVYLTFHLCQYLFFVSGAFALICVCAYHIVYKHKLTADVDNCLQTFWGTFYGLVETPMLMFAMTELTLYTVLLFDYTTMYGAIFLYVFGSLDRLRACLMLQPILNRMAYNVNAKCLFVLGWSGVRGTLNMYILLTLIAYQQSTVNLQSYLLSSMCYVILSNLINCTTMRVLLNTMGMMTITTSRLNNMYSCMTFLKERQVCMLNILKNNRYLSNANWALIRKESFVYGHYLHKASAYRQAQQYNEETNYKFNDRVLICPDCHKEFRNDYTEMEMENLLNVLPSSSSSSNKSYNKKNLLQILKSQKVAIIKQHENGFINKHVLQILVHHLDTKIESNKRRKNTTINLDQFNPKAKFKEIVIKILMSISQERLHVPPHNACRRFCFYLQFHSIYEIIFLLMTITNAAFIIWNDNKCCRSWMYQYHCGIFAIYVIDSFLKVISVTQTLSIIDIAKAFCKDFWMIFDFTLLVLGFMNIFITNSLNVFDWLIYYIPSFRVLSVVRLFISIRMLGTYSMKIVKSIEYTIDTNIALRFALAAAWLNSLEEMLNALPQIVEERIAREFYDNNLKEERTRLLDEMANVQKTRPWIAVTVKTQQAVGMALYAIDVMLRDMQREGYTDAIETAEIVKVLRRQQKFLRQMKFLRPNAVPVIFEGVPWMPHENDEVMQYLYVNAKERSLDAQEVILDTKQFSEGVYVVVTGVLILVYQPRSRTHIDKITGALPIVDYLATTDYHTGYEEVVVSGCTVGELGIVAERAYDCTIYAGSPSQGYWLPANVIRAAIKMCNHPVTGLETRIWRHCCQKLAVAIIMQASKYTACTKDEIKVRLQRAFMPVMRSYKSFIYTSMIEDLVLIRGTAIDQDNEEVFVAPKLIPIDVKKLRFISEAEPINILIVPKDDVDPMDIMQIEEEMADLGKGNYNDLMKWKTERDKSKLDKKRKSIIQTP